MCVFCNIWLFFIVLFSTLVLLLLSSFRFFLHSFFSSFPCLFFCFVCVLLLFSPKTCDLFITSSLSCYANQLYASFVFVYVLEDPNPVCISCVPLSMFLYHNNPWGGGPLSNLRISLYSSVFIPGHISGA